MAKKTRKVLFISSSDGDWEAMYIDGKKVAEGHSLPYWEVLHQLNIHYESREVEVDEFAPCDSFPEELES